MYEVFDASLPKVSNYSINIAHIILYMKYTREELNVSQVSNKSPGLHLI